MSIIFRDLTIPSMNEFRGYADASLHPTHLSDFKAPLGPIYNNFGCEGAPKKAILLIKLFQKMPNISFLSFVDLGSS